MDSEGGNVTPGHPLKASVEKPGWSPDGQFLVFASDLEGNRDIYITDANGNGLLKVSTSPLEDFYPAWSPLKETVNKTVAIAHLAG